VLLLLEGGSGAAAIDSERRGAGAAFDESRLAAVRTGEWFAIAGGPFTSRHSRPHLSQTKKNPGIRSHQ
jgi:hypothetical protein